jgi:hypothetical protein
MSYGPYVKLNSGLYKISFLYKCKKDESGTVGNPGENAVYFQVAVVFPSTGNQEVNSYRNVTLSSCDSTVSVASWLFNVDDVAATNNTFEFRVISDRNAEIKL